MALSGRHSSVMISVLDSGMKRSVFETRLEHCVVFLGKTLYSPR